MNRNLASFFILNLLLALTTVIYSQTNSGRTAFREGRYEGQAFNTTVKQRGSVLFELYDIDTSSGQARAYFGASNGLVGEAWLTGRISENGELDLSGPLLGYTMQLKGHVTQGGSIDADYKLVGTNPQEGNFEVAFKQGFADRDPNTTSLTEQLIGAWEIGGGLPAEINPITGRATGVSFVEAHRLEFLPDGQFKHLWSHRHCEAGIRCCSEQAKLEEGRFSLNGRQLDFDITGGTLIASDSCNSRINGHTPVAKHKESFTVTVRSESGSEQLCLQNGTQQPTCYQKQS
jgi:hypothetical protein